MVAEHFAMIRGKDNDGVVGQNATGYETGDLVVDVLDTTIITGACGFHDRGIEAETPAFGLEAAYWTVKNTGPIADIRFG